MVEKSAVRLICILSKGTTVSSVRAQMVLCRGEKWERGGGAGGGHGGDVGGVGGVVVVLLVVKIVGVAVEWLLHTERPN